MFKGDSGNNRSVKRMKTIAAIFFNLTILVVANARDETPLRADSFVDAIGINIGNVSEGQPTAYSNIANVTASIKDLGIRHIRVFPIPYTNEIKSFAAIARGAGAKLDFMIGRSGPGQWYIDTKRNVIAPKNPLVLRRDYLIPYLSSLEYIEGPNESSCHSKPFLCLDGPPLNHPKGTIAFQNALFNSLRNPPNSYDSSPPIKLPLIGPSGCMTDVSAAELRGCKLDFQNIHSYADKGYGPDWGITYGTKYAGSFDYIGNADAINEKATKLPIIITETGYNTGSKPDKGIQLPVSQLAQAKYYPRIFADAMLVERIKRVYTWELFDPTNAGNANASYGLVAVGPDGTNQVKKPAYNAEKSLIGLLAEPGASFTPDKLGYDISAPSTVNHLLLQKSNHDYYLLLWQAVPVYGYAQGKGTDIANTPVNVTVTFDKNFGAATQYAYNNNWTFATTPIEVANKITVSVPDTVTVVKISGL
jgi:hypothetical protein